MTSFGEAELIVESRNVARVRVRSIDHGDATFPRLNCRIGVTLQEHPKGQFNPGRAIEKFEMRDLSGELRLTENSQASPTPTLGNDHIGLSQIVV